MPEMTFETVGNKKKYIYIYIYIDRFGILFGMIKAQSMSVTMNSFHFCVLLDYKMGEGNGVGRLVHLILKHTLFVLVMFW